jgi:hypothetical protein
MISGTSADAIEAVLVELTGAPLPVQEFTGARHPTVAGLITPGRGPA